MHAPRTRLFSVLVAVAFGTALGCAGPGAGTAPSSGSAAPARMRPLLARVILDVHDRYDDPARIDPREMIRAALRAVHASFPEVVVQEDPSGAALTISIAGDSDRVALDAVNSIWRTATVLDSILTFVESRLPPSTRPGLVTELAVDGLAKTLDPRSGLLDARTLRPIAPSAADGTGDDPRAAAGSAPPPTVASRTVAAGVAYVKLGGLRANARKELSDAIAARRAEAGGALRGVVLDLRGSTGGLLDAAVGVADLFLASGPIVTTVSGAKKAAGSHTVAASAEPDDLPSSIPVVVLVDGGTAAGSEIVAAALRDAGRALVVGTRTAGYGKVQSLLAYDGDARHPPPGVHLRLTTAHLVTAGGAPLDGAGLVPDVEVGPAADDAALRLASEVLAREPSPDRAPLLEAARALRAPR